MGYAVRCELCRQGVMERKRIPCWGTALSILGYLVVVVSAMACLFGFIVWLADYVPPPSTPYPERLETRLAEHLSAFTFFPGLVGVLVGLSLTAKTWVVECSICHVVSADGS